MSRRRQTGEEIAAENQALAMQKKRADLERQLREKEDLLNQYRSNDRSNSYANLQAQIQQIRSQLDQQSIPRIQAQSSAPCTPTGPPPQTTRLSSARYVVPEGKTLRDVVWEQKRAQWKQQQSLAPSAPAVFSTPLTSGRGGGQGQSTAPPPQSHPMVPPLNAVEAQQCAARFGRRATPPPSSSHTQGYPPQQAANVQKAPPSQAAVGAPLVDTGRPPSFGRRSQGGQPNQTGTRPW